MNSDYFLKETTLQQANSFYIGRDSERNSINKWLLCPWEV